MKQQFAETVAAVPELQRYVPTCEYHLVDLRDEELRGAVLLQVTLKYIFRAELGERLPEILRLLRELEAGSSGLDFIRSLLRYLAQTAGTDRLDETTLREAVTQALSGGDELMMTIAEMGAGRKAGKRVNKRAVKKVVKKGCVQNGSCCCG